MLLTYTGNISQFSYDSVLGTFVQIGPTVQLATAEYSHIAYEDPYLMQSDKTAKTITPYLVVGGSGSVEMVYVGVASGGTTIAPADATGTVYVGEIKRNQ